MAMLKPVLVIVALGPPPCLADPFIAGRTLEVRSDAGMEPLPAASGATASSIRVAVMATSRIFHAKSNFLQRFSLVFLRDLDLVPVALEQLSLIIAQEVQYEVRLVAGVKTIEKQQHPRDISLRLMSWRSGQTIDSESLDSVALVITIEQYKARIKRLQESEVEIKSLSINYAAIRKEEEDQISRLNQENGSLKQNLDATKEALNVSRTARLRISTSSISAIKGSGDRSPKRPQSANQAKSRGGNQIQNGPFPKYDGTGNGILHHIQSDVIQRKMEAKKDKIELSRWEEADPNDSVKNLQGVIATLEKENDNLKIEKNKPDAALQISRNSSTDKLLQMR
ncbi:hypothetical protein SADUNF_Sadunf02G0138000 [Salix dunnii]|uniref:Uncharacterized protein n=1 Tax=Salix dunnii TaxID=1413687 RepID=A0A835TI07_9ROSI|nr:hypothetical protein SADUNF_Sadunf02G0138000 [Salix dunnii]